MKLIKAILGTQSFVNTIKEYIMKVSVHFSRAVQFLATKLLNIWSFLEKIIQIRFKID